MIRYLSPKMEALLHDTDQSGSNILHFAAQEGHTDVVQLAVEEYKIDTAICDKVSVYYSPIGLPSGVL